MVLSVNYSADVLTSLVNNTQYVEEVASLAMKSCDKAQRELAYGFLIEFATMCKTQAQVLGQIYRVRPEMIIEVFVR